MKKYMMAAGGLLAAVCIWAQEISQAPFAAPLDFPLYLSGNFGELRANHFHGGVDFKTQGTEGKTVTSIADGYISRVTVSAGGYGNAVYVTHPDGYVSVYGHLKAFLPPVAERVEEYQYANETFQADLSFGPDEFPVKKGSRIAWSGNTGYSFGPHLHLEIRKADTGEHLDPLQFYMNKVKDTTPPRAHAIAFYPQAGKGIVNGKINKQIIAVTAAAAGKNCLSVPIEAWGQIGFGIKAFDYMNGTNNKYGVRSVTLYADSIPIFKSTVKGYLPEENRMINSWTDFGEYKQRRSWIMKSFVAPGNRLRMLEAGEDRGIVTIDEERPYVFRYELKDLSGNTSTYTFTVQGKRMPVPEYRPQTKHYLSWNRTNVVQEPGMELVIPRGMLYEDVALNCRVRKDTNAVAFDYYIHDKPLPLHAGCELLIGVRNQVVADTSKYYIVRKVGKKKYSAGGTWQNGWIKAKIRELGIYTVEVDTVPPKVEPVGKTGWGKTGTIIYKIGDYGTGIKSYKGKIDGKFALFAFHSKSGRLVCKLDPKRVRKGIRHRLELVVEDYSGNQTLVEEQFIW